jgi:hypothetical protein
MEFKRELIDEWVTLWNRYDLSRVPELFLNDQRVTYFSSERQGVIKSIEELTEHHRDFGFVEGGKEQENSLWLEDVDIEAFENSSVVAAIWCFSRGGSGDVQKGPVTLVYVLTEDGYRIAHANFSNY